MGRNETSYAETRKKENGQDRTWPWQASWYLTRKACETQTLVKTTLEIVNRMQADGIVGKYAIGGAVGATFYLEPSATLDVDIFVVLPTAPGSFLTSLLRFTNI